MISIMLAFAQALFNNSGAVRNTADAIEAGDLNMSFLDGFHIVVPNGIATLMPGQFEMKSFGGLGVNRIIKPEVTDPWWLAGKTLIGDADSHMDKTEPITIVATTSFLFGIKLGMRYTVIQGDNVETMYAADKPEQFAWALGRGDTSKTKVIPQNYV